MHATSLPINPSTLQPFNQLILVTSTSIDDAHQRVQKLAEDDFDEIMEQFSEEQPYLFAYVTALSEELPDTGPREWMILMTLVVWHSYRIETEQIPLVEESVIIEIENENYDRAEEMELIGEEDVFSKIADMIANFNQVELYKYISVEIIDMENQELETESERWQAYSFAILQVVIESFDKAINFKNWYSLN